MEDVGAQASSQDEGAQASSEGIRTQASSEDEGAQASSEGGDVAVRLADFRNEREQEALRRFQAVAYVALRVMLAGLLLIIPGRALQIFGVGAAYAAYALGLLFAVLGFGLLSTCPVDRFDLDVSLQKKPCLRVALGVGVLVNYLIVSLRSRPHLVCAMLSLVMMCGGGKQDMGFCRYWPMSTTMSNIMAFGHAAFAVTWLRSALEMSDVSYAAQAVVYCVSALVMLFQWLRMRRRHRSRTLIFYHVYYTWTLGLAFANMVGFASTFTSEYDHAKPSYKWLTEAIIWGLFPSAVAILGRKRLHSLAADHFDRDQKRKQRDGAFIAGLLDGATVVKDGQVWWVHRPDGRKDSAYPRFDHRHHWYIGKVINVGFSEFTVEYTVGEANPTESCLFPLATYNAAYEDFVSIARNSLRCMDWQQFSLQLLTSGAGAGDFDLSRPISLNEVIDFFMSHSWHDDGVAKYDVLAEFATDFGRRHGRDATFWLDKTCINQSNIRDGLRVLPVNVMACKQVLVIWGATYPNRLWCIWELFTLVAFMRLDQAARCIRLAPLGDDFGPEAVAASLEAFDVKNAHCYDPNEEAQLRHVINANGASYFNSKIHALGDRFAAKLVTKSWTSSLMPSFARVLSSSKGISAPAPAPAVIGDADIPHQGELDLIQVGGADLAGPCEEDIGDQDELGLIQDGGADLVGPCEEETGEASAGAARLMLPPFTTPTLSASAGHVAAVRVAAFADQREEMIQNADVWLWIDI